MSLSLLRLERKQKDSSNPFRIRILLFLSYSFAIETMNKFIHSRNSLKNYIRFQTKMGKVYTRSDQNGQSVYPFSAVFRPKRRKNPTRWGGTYLYSLYKGLPLPPESLSMSMESKYISNVFLYLRSLRKEGYTQAEIHYLFQSLVIPNLTYGLPSVLCRAYPGVPSYISYMGMCHPIGLGFWAVLLVWNWVWLLLFHCFRIL